MNDHPPDAPASRPAGYQALGLVGFLAVTFGGAGLASWATQTSVNDWYRTLAKPSWTPPNWAFPVAWTVLYTLMAVAAWRVWRKTGFGPAVGMYFVQLLFNVLWSVIFFGLYQPGLALIDILMLWGAIVLTMRRFQPIDRPAVLLLAPYLAWVTFAAALNGAIVAMNRAVVTMNW